MTSTLLLTGLGVVVLVAEASAEMLARVGRAAPGVLVAPRHCRYGVVSELLVQDAMKRDLENMVAV